MTSTAAKLYAATVHQAQAGRVLDGTDGNDYKNLYDVLADVDQVGNLGAGDDTFVFNHGRARDANIDATIDLGEGNNTIKFSYAESDYERVENGDGSVTYTYITSKDGDTPTYGASVTFKSADGANILFNQGEVPAAFDGSNFVGTERNDLVVSGHMTKDADGVMDMGGGRDRLKIAATENDTDTYHVDMGEGKDVVALKHTIEDYKIQVLDDGTVAFRSILKDGSDGQTFVIENAESFQFYNVDIQTGQNYSNDNFSIEELMEISNTDVFAAEFIGDVFQGVADFTGVDASVFDADGDLTAKFHINEMEIA